MEQTSAAAKMDDLIAQIELHRDRYYQQNNPLISDNEYDQLETELKDLERRFPNLVRAHSPSFRVGGAVADSHAGAAHRTPMLSLENAYDRADLKRFFERTHDGSDGDLTYVAELKIDGVSLSLIYRRGTLERAVTRGDGKTGEEVTLNAKTIRELPLRVPAWREIEEMEVRGEVYINHNTFAKLNQNRLSQDLPLFANPRNAAAGSLRLLDSGEVAQRRLSIFVFQALGPLVDNTRHHSKTLALLKEAGFPVNPHTATFKTAEELDNLLDSLLAKRAELPYDVDGVVVKVDDTAFYDAIGYTTKFPKWATAFKFPAEQATTVLKEISIQVGRTGVLTPVAHFDPVQLAGTTVARATLHNFDEIQKKDIRIGDTVFIEKGGDIIPKVVKVIIEKRPPETPAYQAPQNCPSCQSGVSRDEDQVALRCKNPHCPAQLERRIMHFASRNAMDIQGLGRERVLQMVEQQLVTSLASIYDLDEEKLWKLPRVGKKWVANLLGEIAKSKRRPFHRLLFASGIPMIGEKVAEQIAAHFPSLEALQKASKDDIAALHGLGDKVAGSLCEHLKMPAYQHLFSEFKRHGLHLVAEQKAPQDEAELPLKGKVIVITGSFSGMTRGEIGKRLKALGANVTGSVSKKTAYLLAGEKAGSKLEKANKLGVEVVGTTWLEQWLTT